MSYYERRIEGDLSSCQTQLGEVQDLTLRD